jgi:hypothetical protein
MKSLTTVIVKFLPVSLLARLAIFPSPAGMSLTKLLFVTSRLGTRKSLPFLQCSLWPELIVSRGKSLSYSTARIVTVST